jgi:hypothetical protein
MDASNSDNSDIIDLSKFLRKLATDIDNKHLTQRELLTTSEFYIKYQFLQNMQKRGYNDEYDINKLNRNENDGNDGNGEEDMNEWLKFLTLGFFIYKMVGVENIV